MGARFLVSGAFLEFPLVELEVLFYIIVY